MIVRGLLHSGPTYLIFSPKVHVDSRDDIIQEQEVPILVPHKLGSIFLGSLCD